MFNFILQRTNEIKADQKEIIEASNGGLADIKKRKDGYNEQLQIALNEKAEIENLVKVIKHTTNQRVDELIAALKTIHEGR